MILLLGGNGFVGSAFRRFFEEQNIPIACPSLRATHDTFSIALEKAIKEISPDFIINCIGYSGKPNVDAAELNKGVCLIANTELPCQIAQICQQYNVPWGHISSGCIYTGRRIDGRGFTEEDEPNFSFRYNNCSFYSGTKALSEEILADFPNHYLWRLRIPFNEIDSPRNYLSKIMNYDCLIDVENSISQIDEFVRACWLSREKRIPFGTYNVTNPGVVTTREVAEMIDRAGLPHKDWKYFKDEAEFLEKAALTPRANCVMDSSKIQSHGIPLTEVHDSIDWCLRHWKTS